MPRRGTRRGPKPDRRRALELLAASRDGCTEAILLAHGFSIEMMVEMINAGLATASSERVVAGSLWMWTLAFGHHEDCAPTHGYEAPREAGRGSEAP